jgi:hypothetical protein
MGHVILWRIDPNAMVKPLNAPGFDFVGWLPFRVQCLTGVQ